MRIDVYTWQDAYVSTIGPEELLSLTHTDELNGEDSVDIYAQPNITELALALWKDKCEIITCREQDENLEGFKGRVSRDEWVRQAQEFVKEREDKTS